MSKLNFDAGVWHPFGPHGRETAEQIIERKRQEIDANGWTLWSFQYRRPEVLEAWSRRLSEAKDPVTFCSNSPGAVDPAEIGPPTQPISCRSYKPAFHDEWLPFPAAVKVPHPFKNGKTLASAFIVRRIVHPFEWAGLPLIQWLSKGEWRDKPLLPRGIPYSQRGGCKIRPVRALLELRAPFSNGKRGCPIEG